MAIPTTIEAIANVTINSIRVKPVRNVLLCIRLGCFVYVIVTEKIVLKSRAINNISENIIYFNVHANSYFSKQK